MGIGLFLIIGAILTFFSTATLIVSGVSNNEKIGICSFGTLVCGVYLVITAGLPMLLV